MQHQFRLTGKHVLACLLGFFALILTVNVIFINFAVRSFPGEQEKKSYLQGLNYNDRLVSRSQQAELGWRVVVEEAVLIDDQLHLKIIMSDDNGDALSGLKIDGVLVRPANAGRDQDLEFINIGNGVYRALAKAGPGLWDIKATSINANNDVFEFNSRLVLQ